jgi:hypothetical protein
VQADADRLTGRSVVVCVFRGKRRASEPTVTTDRWFLSVRAPKATTPDDTRDLDALQGSWKVAQIEWTSREVPADEVQGFGMVLFTPI